MPKVTRAMVSMFAARGAAGGFAGVNWSAIWLACALVVLSAPTLAGASAFGIRATVNGEPISNYDIDSRIKLFTGSTELPRGEALAGLRERVTLGTIRDRLQLQAAASTIPSPAQLEQAVAEFLRERGQTVESFQAAGFSLTTLREQVSAQIAWRSLIESQFQGSVRIDDDEVQQRVAHELAQFKDGRYRYVEIVLPFDESARPGSQLQMQALAEEVRRRVQGGGNFGEYARQVSASPSAQRGGLVDWTAAANIQQDVLAALKGLAPNELSSPILLPGAYALVGLIGRQQPVREQDLPLLTEYMVQRVTVPIASGASAGYSRAAAVRLGETLQSTFLSCDDSSLRMATIAGVEVRTEPARAGGQLPPSYRAAILQTKPSEALPLEVGEDAVSFVALCSTAAPEGTALPTFESARNRLYELRLRDKARQLMALAERNAVITLIDE